MFFINLFIYFFHIYIKVLKNLSAKYYQENKEELKKKLVTDIKIFLRNKMKKAAISSGTLQKSFRQ